MSGRKRTPDAIKQLTGTAQPCRMNPDAPIAAEGVAEPPDWLSARAAEIFADLAAITDRMRIASPDDVAMLALLASRLEEIEACTAVIEDLGRVYQTVGSTGAIMHRARPEVGMRNEGHAPRPGVARRVRPLARRPLARLRDHPAEENPFKDL